MGLGKFKKLDIFFLYLRGGGGGEDGGGCDALK